uniref:Uncharacterized protein n=2 Tax=Odontella aurita TaxID=265563 RepID=A0A7S4NE70_9STRA|mmetsp:Transcript_59836/g.177316  ORF Transcript_59836/g.177316 Transcript_59836/m.177316 type:complete len:290 (+) Transcript_59836:424-1293(+)|eukprot:CAMPEP_0113545074 /NCGR_PEP_ID=MMETSP0015_2-20120614/11060_1 /TAXON_ID=2838 /ORGANISM="Odontella" /LENGTH=289 /DNA_ID=CAMNT_0000445401 /DNA_START=213 /DNA_END=1082 /DNA_ORIENTATION=+ /assembly_acc=CAM_ASM_000160
MILPQRSNLLLLGGGIAFLALPGSASAFTARPRNTPPHPLAARTLSARRSTTDAAALAPTSMPPPSKPARSAAALLASRSSVVVSLRSSRGSSSGVEPTDDEDSASAATATAATVRGKLRALTGFSLTAFRATMRATTGFSLTAVRAACRVATGISVTGTMKWMLGLFPTWFRYFLQPFLVLYYAPLMIVRAWVGPTATSRAEALAKHERVVEGWKDAVRVAEGAQEGGYWPVHVDDDGSIVAALPPEPDLVLGNFDASPRIDSADLAEAVFESVEYAESRKEGGGNEE